MIVGRGNDESKPHEWKKLCSKELGVKTSRITKPAKFVLNVLRKKGMLCFLFLFASFVCKLLNCVFLVCNLLSLEEFRAEFLRLHAAN